MPQSNLFQYISHLDSEGKMSSIPMGRRFKRERKILEGQGEGKNVEYYLLFNADASKGENPFSDSNNISKESHLRIDEIYFSEESAFRSRRRLPFCHATEYFILKDDAHSFIQVHYYFDRNGNMYNIVCTKDEQQIRVGSHIELALFERSKAYGTVVKEMLKGMFELTISLRQSLDSLQSRIFQNLLKNKPITNDLKILREQSTLYAKLNSDSKAKIGTKSFFEMIERVQLQQQQAQQVKKEVAEELQSVEEDTITPSKTTMRHSKSVPAKKSNFNKQLKSIERMLSELENSDPNKQTSYNSEDLQKYLDMYMQVQENMLALLFNNSFSNKQQLEDLYKRRDQLKNEGTLLFTAIKQINFEQIKIIITRHPSSFTVDMCHEIIELMINSTAEDIDRINKLIAIVSFLNDNSTIFRAHFPNICEGLHNIDTSDTHYSILSILYYKKLPELFRVLLDCGVDTYATWSQSNNQNLTGPEILLGNPSVDGLIYYEMLKEYGYNIEHARTVLNLSEREIMENSGLFSRAERSRLKKDLTKKKATIQAFQTGDTTSQHSRKTEESQKPRNILLDALVYRIQGTADLYAAFAADSSVEILLMSAAKVSMDLGLQAITTPDLNTLESNGYGHTLARSSLPIDPSITQKSLDMFKCISLALHDKYQLESFDLIIEKLHFNSMGYERNGFHLHATASEIAIVFAYVMFDRQKDAAEQISKSWVRAANLLLQQVADYKCLLKKFLEDPTLSVDKRQRNIEGLKTEIYIILYRLAYICAENAIQYAYFSECKELRDTVAVREAFEITELVSKDLASHKTFARTAVSSPAYWQESAIKWHMEQQSNAEATMQEEEISSSITLLWRMAKNTVGGYFPPSDTENELAAAATTAYKQGPI